MPVGAAARPVIPRASGDRRRWCGSRGPGPTITSPSHPSVCVARGVRDDGDVNTRKVRFVPVALPVVLSRCGRRTGRLCRGDREGRRAVLGETGLVARAAEPSDGVLVLGSTEPAELALTSSQAFFTNAPVVVLATADDEAARATAAAAAVDLAAPVLLVGGAISDGGLRTELSRLGTVAVVEVGEAEAPPGQEDAGEEPARATLGDVDGVERVLLEVGALLPDGTLDERDLDEVRSALPERGEPETLTEVLALTEPGSLATPGGPQSAAIATARAAGAVPLEVPQGDPRASAEVVDAISAAKALAVVGIGEGFGTADDLAWRLRSAEAGDLLPSGSQLVLADGVRYVAVEADAVTSGLVAVGSVRRRRPSRARRRRRRRTPRRPRRTWWSRCSRCRPRGRRRTRARTATTRRRSPPRSSCRSSTPRRPPGCSWCCAWSPAERASTSRSPSTRTCSHARPWASRSRSTRVVQGRVARGHGGRCGAQRRDRRRRGGRAHAGPAAEARRRAATRRRGGARRRRARRGGGRGRRRAPADLAVGLRRPRARVGTLLDDVPAGVVGGWTTGSADPARDVEGVLSLDPSPRYVAPSR